jgi:signal peptidase I
MDDQRLEKAFKELRSESLSRGFSIKFKVVGDSMRPLINAQDEVEVFKAGIGVIGLGDIIAWKKDDDPERLPVIHRVVAKKTENGAVLYHTKGDNSLFPDNAWAEYGDIIGRVESIRKHSLKIVITGGAGRVLCLAAGTAMTVYTAVLSKILKVVEALKALAPSGIREFDRSDMLLAYYSLGSERLETATAVPFMMEKLCDAVSGKSVADMQADGGFSEEACSLMRKNVGVERLEAFGSGRVSAGRYDFVIISNIINYLPNEGLRREVLLKAAESLKPGGRILLFCSNSYPGLSVRFTGLRDRLWSYVTGRASCGSLTDIYRGGRFIKRKFDLRQLESEAVKCGLKTVMSLKKGNFMATAVTQ